MATRVRFDYSCPVKLNPRFDAGGNYACPHCHRNVLDFTGKDARAVQKALADENGTACGTFRQVYYEGRAGRMQQRLIQRLTRLREGRRTWAKRMLIPFMLVLTFLMGCRTRGGSPAYGVKQKPVPVEKAPLLR